MQKESLAACPEEARPLLQAMFNAQTSAIRVVTHRSRLQGRLSKLLGYSTIRETHPDVNESSEIRRLRLNLKAADERVEEVKAHLKRIEAELIECLKECRIKRVPAHRREEALQLLEQEKGEIQAVHEAVMSFADKAKVDFDRQRVLLEERTRIGAQIRADYDRRLDELAVADA
ncbi:hypothetical protein EON81_15110 [bacterium]|nr:MAG: hypothetical protein EON81_15110 [bacterium]